MSDSANNEILTDWNKLQSKYQPDELIHSLHRLRWYQVKLAYQSIIKFFGFLCLLCALYWTLYQEPIKSKYLTETRLFLIHWIKPYFDWTKLYSNKCFLNNPFLSDNHIIIPIEECTTLCKNVNPIDSISIENLRSFVYFHDYIKTNKPLIIRKLLLTNKEEVQAAAAGAEVDDELEPIWKNVEEFDEFLTKTFSNTKEFFPCATQGSVQFKSLSISPRQHFHRMMSSQSGQSSSSLNSWFLFWENCHEKKYKSLRPFYKRPFLLPLGMEIMPYNSVLVARNITESTLMPIPSNGAITFAMQLSGSSIVQIRPYDPCNENLSACLNVTSQTHILRTGDAISLSNDQYELLVRPHHRLTDANQLSVTIFIFLEQ